MVYGWHSIDNIHYQSNDSMRLRSEFDDFITNNNAPSARGLSPRRMLNNLTNQQPKPIPPKNHNLSPNRISHTRKPMISPVKQQRAPPAPMGHNQQAQPMGQQFQNRTRPMLGQPQPQAQMQPQQPEHDFYCANENHRNKKAEFVIPLQEEDMYYCGICATQAASQGFPVNRITAQQQQPQAKQATSKQIPYYPQMQHNPKAHQLKQVMQDIIQAEGEFHDADPKAVGQHYQAQERLLNNFYDQIVQSVQRMREEHLNDLRNEEQASRQHCEMNYDNLKMHMEELDQAWEDMEENFELVAEQMGQEEFESGIREYQKTIDVFRVKLEEYGDFMGNLTAYQPHELTQKVAMVEERLGSLWQSVASAPPPPQEHHFPMAQPRSHNPPMTRTPNSVRTMHEKLPQPGGERNCEGQAAFRNIFPDDEDGDLPDPAPSPQFKNI